MSVSDVGTVVPATEPAPGPVPPPPTRRWAHGLVTAGVIVAAAVHVWLRLSSLFYFHHDDLLEFSVAQEKGLSWDLLRLNVFGHFAPFNRLVHLFLVRVADADLQVGAAVATGLVVTLMLTTLWLCREIGLGFWRRTFVLLFTGFSVAVLDTAVWMDAAIHILAALTVTYAIVAAHVRAVRTGRRRWHVISVVLFALGFATQERTAFALPLIVLVDVFLLGSGLPWRRRLAGLWRSRWPLIAMTVLSVVAMALLLRFYGAPDTGRSPTLVDVGTVFAGFMTAVLFPMLVGLVPSALPSVLGQLGIAVVLLGAAALLVRRNRANAGPILLVLATAVMYYGFLRFSPILVPQNVEETALRLNNAVYLLVPTLVALAHLRLSRVAPAGSAQPAPLVVPRPGRVRRLTRSRVTRPIVLAVSALLLVVTAGAYTGRAGWDLAREGHTFIDNVSNGADRWSSPDITLLPLRAPAVIADGWAEDYGREAHFLKYFRNGWAPAPLRGNPAVLDARGLLRPVVLRHETTTVIPRATEGPACVRSRTGADFLVLPLRSPVRGAPLFAQFTYRLTTERGDDATLVVAATDRHGDVVPSWSTPFPAGRHTVVVPLQSDTATGLNIAHIPVGSRLCIAAASVVRPLYVIDGNCVLMDEFGATNRATDCPVRRPQD